VTRIFLAISAIIFLISAKVSAEPLEIKLAHIGEPGSLYDLSATEYAKRVNAQLWGVARITVFGSSQLGDDTQVLGKLKTGDVTLSLPSTVFTSVHPCFGVFEMPFLVRNRDHVRKIRDVLFEGPLRGFAEEKGFFLLGMWENGFRHITNDMHAIVTPGDLEGLQLRVPKGIWRIKMFEAYGAKAVPTGLETVYAGLKGGMIDGQESPLSIIEKFRFYKVQKYLTLSGHVYAPLYLTADSGNFRKLPPGVQTVLEKTALDMQDWTLKKGYELDRQSKANLEKLMEVNEIDPLAFTIASLQIYREFVTAEPQCKALFAAIFALTPPCDALNCSD
jgi:tripartite ATP-independent transporter DctP family solute receptor